MASRCSDGGYRLRMGARFSVSLLTALLSVFFATSIAAALAGAKPASGAKPNPHVGADSAEGSPGPTPAASNGPAASSSDTQSLVPDALGRTDADTFLRRVSQLVALAKALHESCGLAKPADDPSFEDAADDEAARLLSDFKTHVCTRLCDGAAKASVLDLCAFRKQDLAAAAVVADWENVARVNEFIRSTQAALALAPETKAEQSPLVRLRTAGNAIASSRESAQLSLLGTGLFSADEVARFASGLARFIVDRAKREGVAWFLAEMGKNLCGLGSSNDQASVRAAQVELRAYWFPALCSLAASPREFMRYGGGGQLFQTLRSAVISDVSGWPAASAGLALGSVFWSTASQPGQLFACNQDPSAGACPALLRMRKAGGRFVDALLRGRDPLSQAFALGTELDGANRQPKDTGSPQKKAALYSASVQFAACAASLPVTFQAHRDDIRAVLTNELDQARALFFSGLATAPACFAIVGQGVVTASCDIFGGTGNDCTTTIALEDPAGIERLGTLARLQRLLGDRTACVSEQWRALEQAIDDYNKLAPEPAPAPSGSPVRPAFEVRVTDSDAGVVLLKMLEEQTAAAARRAEQSGAVRRLRAAVRVARAAVNLSESTLDVAQGASDPALYPGCDVCDAKTVAKTMGKATTALDTLSRNLSLLESALDEDWGTVTVGALENLRLAAPDTLRSVALSDEVTRYLGVVTAIASERDPDAIAEAIENAADPVGGWRAKGQSGAWTVSITAHAGIFGGIEWRYGRDGDGPRERGGDIHKVLPTLVLPTGLEIAHGSSCFFGSPFALYFSLIDPAAFLQYDSDHESSLPAPRPTTLLAPGLGLRFGFRDTPFSLSPFLFYRPALRTRHAAIDAPAADALQLGLNASVDVTLLELSRSGG